MPSFTSPPPPVTVAVSTTTVPEDTDVTVSPLVFVTESVVEVETCANTEPARPKSHSRDRQAASDVLTGVPGRKEKDTRRLLRNCTRQLKRRTGNLGGMGTTLPKCWRFELVLAQLDKGKSQESRKKHASPRKRIT